MIPVMSSALTMIAIWATAIVPQLCRVGVLSACCAEGPQSQTVPISTSVCTTTGCGHSNPVHTGAPTEPGDADCGSCQNFCGTVIAPPSISSPASQVRAERPAPMFALASDDAQQCEFAQLAESGAADIPRLPCPPSDFPLLN